ncbi:cytochrome c oxidase assembly protein COX19-like isoform X1 [Rhopilema esculentum]|uniref:cytochrome c oxidase assembly protein COX19-like isoform X1 n=1 Tax=Rhopilema esculentum TaxID=499914 RepID=UPI0031D2DB0C
MNPGNNPLKVFNRTPPAKGSFPLDHDGECKTFMKTYMQCLQKNKNQYEKCVLESKEYLQCRMERDLMSQEDFRRLGFKEEESGNQDSRDT